MNNIIKKLLTEANASLEKGNHNHTAWCCLDVAWYLLTDNAEAQAAIKTASELIYPKRITSNRGWRKGRKRNG